LRPGAWRQRLHCDRVERDVQRTNRDKTAEPVVRDRDEVAGLSSALEVIKPEVVQLPGY